MAETSLHPGALADRLARLEAEADIRRLAARYMALCDAPPADAPGCSFEDLFTADVVWEGVGWRAEQEFGRVEGRDRLLAWFERLRTAGARRYSLNVHYLTSEAITATDDKAVGHWLLLQPALLQDGGGELRMARLRIAFRREPDAWRIARFQTESLLKAEGDADQLRALRRLVRP